MAFFFEARDDGQKSLSRRVPPGLVSKYRPAASGMRSKYRLSQHNTIISRFYCCVVVVVDIVVVAVFFVAKLGSRWLVQCQLN